MSDNPGNQVTTTATEVTSPPLATPTVEVNGEKLAVEPQVESLEGVLATLQKYQKYGSIKDIEKATASAQQFKALADAVSADGFDITNLPQMLKEITAKSAKEEAFEQELTERFESRLKLQEIEAHKQIAELQKEAAAAKTQLLDKNRGDQIYPYFSANAEPEALREWGDYWGKLKDYVEFEEGTHQIKQVLGPDKRPLLITQGGETVEGTIKDLFIGVVNGDYGYQLKAAMRPISRSTGGGVINPATGGSSTISRERLGSLSQAELTAAKKKIASGEVRVVD